MAKFTMTEFMEDTEKKYGDMELEVPVRNEKRELVLDEEGQPQTKVARFRYFLRINQADRSRLAEAFKYVNGEKEVEQEDGEDGEGEMGKQQLIFHLHVIQVKKLAFADKFHSSHLFLYISPVFGRGHPGTFFEVLPATKLAATSVEGSPTNTRHSSDDIPICPNSSGCKSLCKNTACFTNAVCEFIYYSPFSSVIRASIISLIWVWSNSLINCSPNLAFSPVICLVKVFALLPATVSLIKSSNVCFNLFLLICKFDTEK